MTSVRGEGFSQATSREARSILSNHCFQCHGPDAAERQADLRLDQSAGAAAELTSGRRAVVPGEPSQSELISRINSSDPDERMPPPDVGKKLSSDEIELLTDWIRQGAAYSQHWSHRPAERPDLPAVADATWPRGEIDSFILARLEQEGLRPSPPADRRALIRRMSLDLTGLPPLWDEVEALVGDAEPGAVERLVDRLLAQDAFGEHWARKWLDLARYADSAGYANDPPRTIWAYRDWVIRAINDNMPFDRFTILQLAGDLLPEATDDQLIATAFHRNTLTNSEGGTDDEEFRNVAIVDRVNTTMAVWMGTTMACAQCHSHKFDPITQEEYFQMFAILNGSEDADQRDERPLFERWTDQQQKQRADLRQKIATLEIRVEAVAPADRDQPQSQEAITQLAEVKKQLDEIKPHFTVPIMRELPPEKRRKTHIQQRGNFLNLGQEVTPGLPVIFPPPADGGQIDRLALAQWLVADNNPLTARVLVNRYWETIFGVGLVRTSEDFGSQGEPPSHPELLDWLATELIRQRWDTKALLRLIVTSATYRQSSAVTPTQAESDPENRLLARGPRFRLSAEMIRDQALFVGGLLSRQLYGPPVRPPQPKFGLTAAFGSGVDWQTSEGSDRYRRALYTTWRRSSPYPSMTTFDAPNREVCTVRRARTNTPLQALVTLNDPVYVEAAQGLARRMAALQKSPADQVKYGFRWCLARDPDADELTQLVDLFDEVHQRMTQDPKQAKKLATDPLGPIPDGADTSQLAAWTVVANVMLNLDEMLLKR